MSGAVRRLIRSERDRLARDHLRALGYVLDYWLVYRVADLTAAPLAPTQRLRAGSRGSSRRLHENRMRGLT